MRTPPIPALHERLHAARAGMFGLAHHADRYDRVAARLAQPLYRRVVADVTDLDLPAGAAVLDVGTGPGRVPLLIAQCRPDLAVEGTDLAPEMVDRAIANAATSGPARPEYRIADVAALPHADSSVDLVVSTLSLHHWADPVAGLAEVRRVLRPGGTAWIYDARPVLTRIADQAVAAGIAAVVEPLTPRRRPTGRVGRLSAGLLRRLAARLRIDG